MTKKYTKTKQLFLTKYIISIIIKNGNPDFSQFFSFKITSQQIDVTDTQTPCLRFKVLFYLHRIMKHIMDIFVMVLGVHF